MHYSSFTTYTKTNMLYLILNLLLLACLEKVASHQNENLCAIAKDYCGFKEPNCPQQNAGSIGASTPRVGKAGPRGPPGPPAVVNYTKVQQELDARVAEMEAKLEEKLQKYEKIIRDQESKIRDLVYPSGCDQVHKRNAKTWDGKGGLFRIYPAPNGEEMEVYCDLTTDGGGWTVFQRRLDGSEDFYRGWNEYVAGFGQKDKEFWLGLDTLHELTRRGSYELRVDLTDWENNTAYALYGTFSVGDASSKYTLTVGAYSGDAGDSLAIHNGHKFSTKDSDNDAHSTENCADLYKGAWWHVKCHNSNLNGLYVKGGPAEYAIGIVWYHWKDFRYSVKKSDMKFRKK